MRGVMMNGFKKVHKMQLSLEPTKVSKSIV